MRTCKTCGGDILYYSDPDDYFYRSDLNFCKACCEEENICSCLGTK